MTLSKTSMSLHNFGTAIPILDTSTVSFANPTSGVTFAVAEINNGSHVTVTVLGNIITIASKGGGNNRGSFTVRVTPTNCGAAQDITVNVAK
jgi:hypothetical protein